jgi:hypothetical protein
MKIKTSLLLITLSVSMSVLFSMEENSSQSSSSSSSSSEVWVVKELQEIAELWVLKDLYNDDLREALHKAYEGYFPSECINKLYSIIGTMRLSRRSVAVVNTTTTNFWGTMLFLKDGHRRISCDNHAMMTEIILADKDGKDVERIIVNGCTQDDENSPVRSIDIKGDWVCSCIPLSNNKKLYLGFTKFIPNEEKYTLAQLYEVVAPCALVIKEDSLMPYIEWPVRIYNDFTDEIGIWINTFGKKSEQVELIKAHEYCDIVLHLPLWESKELYNHKFAVAAVDGYDNVDSSDDDDLPEMLDDARASAIEARFFDGEALCMPRLLFSEIPLGKSRTIIRFSSKCVDTSVE